MSAVQWMGGIPIGKYQWNEFIHYRTKIINYCLTQEKPDTVESKVGKSIKSNLWESTFNFLQQPELIDLNNWIHRSTTDFVNNINHTSYNIAITESWAHVTQPNGFHGPHRHPWSAWSGIFYVYADAPETTGNTFFNCFNMPQMQGYDFFEEEFEVPFIPGSLIIFPSILMHYAKPYPGKDKRIIIAFNSICI